VSNQKADILNTQLAGILDYCLHNTAAWLSEQLLMSARVYSNEKLSRAFA